MTCQLTALSLEERPKFAYKVTEHIYTNLPKYIIHTRTPLAFEYLGISVHISPAKVQSIKNIVWPISARPKDNLHEARNKVSVTL